MRIMVMILIISLILLSGCAKVDKTVPDEDPIQICIDEGEHQLKEGNVPEFVPGEIIVKFIDEIKTEKEVKEIIGPAGLTLKEMWAESSFKEMGLTTESEWISWGVLIKVPEGSEIEWMCKFSQDPKYSSKIEGLNLNVVVHTT